MIRRLWIVLVTACLLFAGASAAAIAEGEQPMYNAFTLHPTQARAVATLMNAMDAYNAGDLDALSAFLTEDILWSDCDYERERVVNFESRKAVQAWLEKRFAEGDRFEIGRILNEYAQAEHLIVGMEIVRRTSTAITAAGHQDGIRPLIAPKISFTPDGTRIVRFANGPSGGAVRCTL